MEFLYTRTNRHIERAFAKRASFGASSNLQGPSEPTWIHICAAADYKDDMRQIAIATRSQADLARYHKAKSMCDRIAELCDDFRARL